MADDRGPIHPVATTAFPFLSLFRSDRDHLKSEAAEIVKSGFLTAGRFLGSMGTGRPGDSWEGIDADPLWPDYEEVAGGTVDLLYDDYGLQSLPTLLSEIRPGLESRAEREAFIDRWARIINARPHKFVMVEIWNEPDGAFEDEVSDLCERLQRQVPILVAPATVGSIERLYVGKPHKIGTLEIDRSTGGDGGIREPIWRPFEWPWGGAQRRCWNIEPPGPYASGYAEFNPLRLALGLWFNFALGFAGYTFHNGVLMRAGAPYDNRHNPAWDKRGEGDIDYNGPGGIPDRVVDTPHWPEICGRMRAALASLPLGIANGQRWNGHWHGDNPIQIISPHDHDQYNHEFDTGGIFKAVCVVLGDRIVYGALWVRREITCTVFRNMVLDEIEPMPDGTPRVIRTLTLSAGQTFTLDPARPDTFFTGHLV